MWLGISAGTTKAECWWRCYLDRPHERECVHRDNRLAKHVSDEADERRMQGQALPRHRLVVEVQDPHVRQRELLGAALVDLLGSDPLAGLDDRGRLARGHQTLHVAQIAVDQLGLDRSAQDRVTELGEVQQARAKIEITRQASPERVDVAVALARAAVEPRQRGLVKRQPAWRRRGSSSRRG